MSKDYFKSPLQIQTHNTHYTQANTIWNTASIVIVIVQSSSRSDQAVCSVRHEAMQDDKPVNRLTTQLSSSSLTQYYLAAVTSSHLLMPSPTACTAVNQLLITQESAVANGQKYCPVTDTSNTCKCCTIPNTDIVQTLVPSAGFCHYHTSIAQW